LLKIIADTIRVKTLTASIIPVLVAHFIYDGQLWVTIFALLSACFIQIGTNLYNDVKDFESGVDTSYRIGPKRATHLEIVSPKTLKITSHGFFLVSILFGIPLVIKGGVPVLFVGLLSVFLGYAYTGALGINLSRSGIADIAVIIFFGVIPLTVLSYLHTDVIKGSSWLVGLGFGFLANVLLSVNNIRDLDTDRKAGRKTIPIRIGQKKARILTSSQMILGILLHSFVAPITIASSILGVYLAYRILFLEDWNKTLALSGLLHLLVGILIITHGTLLD